MKLTIFGATGGTGTRLTEQALAVGHSVTAVVRDPARLAFPAHQRLRTITAPDVTDPAAISPAVADADAVLSGVAPPGTGPSTLRQDSTRRIIQAMQKTGARRRRWRRTAQSSTGPCLPGRSTTSTSRA